MRFPILMILLANCIGGLPDANAGDAAADRWINDTNAQFPELPSRMVASNRFAGLRSEVFGGRLRVVLPNGGFPSNAPALLHASFDEPGHWAARDWEAMPMIRTERQFEAVVRVTEPTVPLVYFASIEESGASAGRPASNAWVSPLRVCRPADAGMSSPSHLFWPFLEGFEESLSGWRLMTPDALPLAKNASARSGKSALLVTLPSNREVVTIATTRVRGWHTSLRRALGLRLWMQTKSGQVRARFAARADALSPNQQVAVFPRQETIGPQWQKVDLWFSDIPGFNLARLDLLTIDFIGQGPIEILVDDIQLLGRWNPEP